MGVGGLEVGLGSVLDSVWTGIVDADSVGVFSILEKSVAVRIYPKSNYIVFVYEKGVIFYPQSSYTVFVSEIGGIAHLQSNYIVFVYEKDVIAYLQSGLMV